MQCLFRDTQPTLAESHGGISVKEKLTQGRTYLQHCSIPNEKHSSGPSCTGRSTTQCLPKVWLQITLLFYSLLPCSRNLSCAAAGWVYLSSDDLHKEVTTALCCFWESRLLKSCLHELTWIFFFKLLTFYCSNQHWLNIRNLFLCVEALVWQHWKSSFTFWEFTFQGINRTFISLFFTNSIASEDCLISLTKTMWVA